MIKKIIKSIIISALIAIVPILGNCKMFFYPHIWVLFIIGTIGSIFQPDYRIIDNTSKKDDNGTELQIIWSVFITQLLIVLEAAYIRFPKSVEWDLFSTVALIFMVLGLILRTWAVHTLGKFFTMHIAVHNEQKIIRNGPYKYFRHPSYVGAFLTYVGTAFLMHSWYSLIICLIILPIVWIRRIYYEEKLLISQFGDKYLEYSKSVKKVIPFIW